MEFLTEMFSGINVTQSLTFARDNINAALKDFEAWEIIACSVLTTLIAFAIKDFIQDIFDDGFLPYFWRKLRQLPIVKQKVQKKLNSTAGEVEQQLQEGLENKSFLNKLPDKGWTKDSILKEIRKYLAYGKFSWEDGYVSGAVYHGNDDNLSALIKEVYGATAYTNPLHPDVFPSARIMEAEIVQMVASLFNGREAVGTVTSGGTESIFLVCKAYRDYAKYEKGIKEPNMVIPVTAHAAFDKAAQMLKIKVKHIPFDDETTRVKLKAMKKALDKNTCMLVGSAPAFPHGSIDPIPDIAKLGRKYNIPVHVDACLGGFLVPFMRKAGFPIPDFDFSVDGVTSISVDTHKYAYAPKGSSVILYKNKSYRHYQYAVQPDWPGGIYGTPNLSGSRSGGIIATCWASLLFHGEQSYLDTTIKIISTTKYIENGLRKNPDIYIIGKPDVSVIAIGSKKFDIYRLSSALTSLGWNLNVLQFPSGFHICITMQHIHDGVADRFLQDVESCTREIMKNPEEKTRGTAAIYGMAQQIPDRSLVSELVWAYLDACYSTKTVQENGQLHN